MHPTILICIAGAMLSAGTLPASAQLLLDYRDDSFQSGIPFYSAAERSYIAAALRQAPQDLATRFAEDFAVLGDASGAFSEAGAQERVFLIQEEAANAIEPFPTAGAPLLLILNGTEFVGSNLLPDNVQYQRLVAAADVNGDGRDDVFLETSFMNMAHTTMSLDVATLGGNGAAEILETLKEVYFDGCENPAGERKRTASTVSVDDGLSTESFSEPCSQ